MSTQTDSILIVDTNEIDSRSSQQNKISAKHISFQKNDVSYGQNYHQTYSNSLNFGGCTLIDEQDTKDLYELLTNTLSNIEIYKISPNKLQINHNDGSTYILVIVGKLVFVGDKNEKLEDITKRVTLFTRYTLFDGKVWTIYGQSVRIPKCKLTGVQENFFDLLDVTDDGRICKLTHLTQNLSLFSDLNS